MGLGHGENETPGLPQAGRPIARAEAGEAQPDHQAPADAHVQVGAGQEARLVGDPYLRIGYSEGFQGWRATREPDIRISSVLVSQSPPRQGYPGQRSRPRRLRDHVSSGISALQRMLKGAFGPRSAPVPPQDAKTHGYLDVSAGSSVQHGLQTKGSRTGGPDSNVHQAAAELDRRAFIIAAAATLGVMAAGRRATETNLPVKIDPPFIHHGSRDGISHNFFPEKGEFLPLGVASLPYWITDDVSRGTYAGIERRRA